MRSTKKIAVLLITVATMLAPLSSRADTQVNVVSPPGGYLTSNVNEVGIALSAGYAPAVLVIAPGTSLQYTNFDVQTHNFISHAVTTDPAKWDPRYCESLKPAGWVAGDPLPPCALFQDWAPDTDPAGSRNITQSAPVLLTMPDGAAKLAAGTPYTFYCSFHTGMTGTLVIAA